MTGTGLALRKIPYITLWATKFEGYLVEIVGPWKPGEPVAKH